MEAVAKAKYQKGSPQKARLVIDLVRGKNVSQALAILKFTNKRAAGPIAKCLNSAIANATYKAEQDNIAIDPDDLWIKRCFVDIGPTKNRRRLRPAPQGRAYFERRHFCHITIEVTSEPVPEVEEKTYEKRGKKVMAKISGGDSNKTHRDTKADKVKLTGDISDAKSETEKTDEEITKTKQDTPKTEDNAPNKDKKADVVREVKVEDVEVEQEAVDAKTETPEAETKSKEEKIATETEEAKSDEKADKKAENTDVSSAVNPETSKEPIDTVVPPNKPLAAQSDEEKTGTDEAADRQIDENEQMEKL